MLAIFRPKSHQPFRVIGGTGVIVNFQAGFDDRSIDLRPLLGIEDTSSGTLRDFGPEQRDRLPASSMAFCSSCSDCSFCWLEDFADWRLSTLRS